VRRDGGVSSLVRAAPGSLRLVKRIAREARPHDVVVCFSQKAFVLASLAKPFMRRPIVWFMNDILSRDHFNPLLVKALVWLSQLAADEVIVNSEASREAWLAAGGHRRRLSIIHPVMSAEVAAEQSGQRELVAGFRREYGEEGSPLIGMFGRICPWKGQDVFLRALALVPGARGVIAGGALFGEEAHEQQMRELARELGIDSRVTFAGHVEQVVALMAACDVVVHCSTAPEPFGRVIVESMFAGTPVIASDAGGAREIVTHGRTGQLTPMRDADALAAAIRRYLADPEWSRQVASEARSQAMEKFSATAGLRHFNQLVASA
jgi:glycosyltransferase involved in cell wall biosynthesis